MDFLHGKGLIWTSRHRLTVFIIFMAGIIVLLADLRVEAWLIPSYKSSPPFISILHPISRPLTYTLQRSVSCLSEGKEHHEDETPFVSKLTLQRFQLAGIIDSFDADTRHTLRNCRNILQIKEILQAVFAIIQQSNHYNSPPSLKYHDDEGIMTIANDSTYCKSQNDTSDYIQYIRHSLNPRLAITALRSWVDQSPMFRVSTTQLNYSTDYYYFLLTTAADITDTTTPSTTFIPDTLSTDHDLDLLLALFYNMQTPSGFLSTISY